MLHSLFKGSSIAGEVSEKSRGHGLQRAVGDLVTCEYCLAPWVAAGLFVTYAGSPRAARFVAALFSSVAVANFLNRAYMPRLRSRRQLVRVRTNVSF